MNDDLVVIKPGFMRHRFSRVLGRSRKVQGFGSVECGGFSDFSRFERMGLESRESQGESFNDGNGGNWGEKERGVKLLTPRRAALAAAPALALGLVGFGPGIFIAG